MTDRFKAKLLDSPLRPLRRAWLTLPQLIRRPPRAAASLNEVTEKLLLQAEIAAERRAAIVRVVVAVLLLTTISSSIDAEAYRDEMVRRQIFSGQVALCLFGMAGVVAYLAATRGIAVRTLPIVTATVDAVLILGIVVFAPRVSLPEHAMSLARLSRLYADPPNTIRLVMLVVLGLILVLVARQGRSLLQRAVRETGLRANLTRYLPRELAPVLSEEAFAGLRAGRRVKAALLFVDIRGSSGFAENMDPTRLAVFISSFRRRVMAATARHGGVVDKFLGDGALVLFGVPTPSEDGDAERALACGRTLVQLMERWNGKRAFEPPLRVGIGVHCGEVFCGVVGQEDRLEFTVLGEPVNIAARIEQSTKALDQPFLASRDAVEAAGELDRWVEVSRKPLRGVTREIVLMAPKP